MFINYLYENRKTMKKQNINELNADVLAHNAGVGRKVSNNLVNRIFRPKYANKKREQSNRLANYALEKAGGDQKYRLNHDTYDEMNGGNYDRAGNEYNEKKGRYDIARQHAYYEKNKLGVVNKLYDKEHNGEIYNKGKNDINFLSSDPNKQNITNTNTMLNRQFDKGKQSGKVRISENELKQIVAESVKKVLNEIGDTHQGQMDKLGRNFINFIEKYNGGVLLQKIVDYESGNETGSPQSPLDEIIPYFEEEVLGYECTPEIKKAIERAYNQWWFYAQDELMPDEEF